MINAIETEYHGFRFRSRLEARWAVFFDRAGIKYQYEPEGFEAVWKDGAYDEENQKPIVIEKKYRYLPDFYLPDFDLWVEVKPSKAKLLEDQEKICACFLGDTQLSHSKGMIILGQIPFFNYSDEFNVPAFSHLWFEDDCINSGVSVLIAGEGSTRIMTNSYYYDGNYNSLELPSLIANEELNHWMKGYCEFDVYGILWELSKSRQSRSAFYLTEWFADARKARFEHGEKG